MADERVGDDSYLDSVPGCTCGHGRGSHDDSDGSCSRCLCISYLSVIAYLGLLSGEGSAGGLDAR